MRKFKYFLCGRALPFAISILLVSAAYLALSLWLPRALAPIALVERLFSFSAGVFVVCSHTFSGKAPFACPFPLDGRDPVFFTARTGRASHRSALRNGGAFPPPQNRGNFPQLMRARRLRLFRCGILPHGAGRLRKNARRFKERTAKRQARILHHRAGRVLELCSGGAGTKGEGGRRR